MRPRKILERRTGIEIPCQNGCGKPSNPPFRGGFYCDECASAITRGEPSAVDHLLRYEINAHDHLLEKAVAGSLVTFTQAAAIIQRAEQRIAFLEQVIKAAQNSSADEWALVNWEKTATKELEKKK